MSILTDAINPILADLAIARADRIEFKGELDAAASMVDSTKLQLADVESKIEIEVAGNNAPDRLRGFDIDRLALTHSSAALSVQQRSLASIVEMAKCHYIGLENSLKSKIREIQGNDALFSTYVPARPGVMSEQQLTPARQLARSSAAMDEYRRLYKEGGFRTNAPLRTV